MCQLMEWRLNIRCTKTVMRCLPLNRSIYAPGLWYKFPLYGLNFPCTVIHRRNLYLLRPFWYVKDVTLPSEAEQGSRKDTHSAANIRVHRTVPLLVESKLTEMRHLIHVSSYPISRTCALLTPLPHNCPESPESQTPPLLPPRNRVRPRATDHHLRDTSIDRHVCACRSLSVLGVPKIHELQHASGLRGPQRHLPNVARCNLQRRRPGRRMVSGHVSAPHSSVSGNTMYSFQS